MQIGKTFFHGLAVIFLASSLIATTSCAGSDIVIDESGSDIKLESQFSVVADRQIENDCFGLSVEENGAFSLLDKSTGQSWSSNPVDRNQNVNIKGIHKMRMNSQLTVDYIVDGKNTKTATSYASSTNKDGVSVSTSADGILVHYNFVDEKFEIPVLYTLNSCGLRAEILNDRIVESGNNQITEIALLPYFAASGLNDQGYFLVPDGSGALIEFNNGKSGNYQQKIYNTNGLMNVKTNKTKVENALLPVFGTYCNNHSLFAVIDGGAGSSKLYGFTSSENGYYNRIYPQFTYRQSSVVSMLSKTWSPVEISFVSSLAAQENFSVLYCPLQNEYGGYSDMANFYRDYLSKTTTFGDAVSERESALTLDFYGGALVERNFCGFPVTVNTALTSFQDAEDICQNLIDDGVKDIRIRYLGITSSGLENKSVPDGFKPASALGGKKGFQRLMDFAGEKGVEIFPDCDFIFYQNSTFSLLSKMDAARDVSKNAGIFYGYNPSNGVAETSDYVYALKPSKVFRAASDYLDSYKKQNNPYISFSTLGSFLYADYSEEIYLPHRTKSIFKEILRSYQGEGFSVMNQAPNAYALEYTSVAVNSPLNSSCFDIEDQTVPFYQMVLHGSVAYTTPAVNMSCDNKETVLKAIETGSGLLYSLSKADYSVIKNDGYDDLYCITAENWLEEIKNNYQKVKAATAGTEGQKIVSHKKAAEGVFCTQYENGISIWVNYNARDVELDGMKIPALDCYVNGGAG